MFVLSLIGTMTVCILLHFLTCVSLFEDNEGDVVHNNRLKRLRQLEDIIFIERGILELGAFGELMKLMKRSVVTPNSK